MKISDIKQQVKRQDRYSIYIDGKYSSSLSENELMHRGLKIDQEFNKESFEEIKQTAVEDKAYMQAVELIARRKRSQWEMQQYLKRKGYSNNTTAKILNKLLKSDCGKLSPCLHKDANKPPLHRNRLAKR